MSNNNIEYLQKQRIVLTASSGRCGTLLLANLLGLVPGVLAEHEPVPYVDNIWWKLRTQPRLARSWLVRHKLPQVKANIIASNASVYVETSHMLCKGFFEHLLDLDIAFDLIILSRNLRDVAMSMHNLNDVPIRTKTGRRWFVNPDDHGNISELPPDRDRLTDYQLCYWYVLEMELRKELYYKNWKDAEQLVVETDLRSLISKRGFKQLLKDLSLPDLPKQSWAEYKLMTMTKYNEKISRKSFMRSKGFTQPYIEHAEEQEEQMRELIKYEDILVSIR